MVDLALSSENDTITKQVTAPKLARLPVSLMAGAVFLALLSTSAFRTYWLDESYFITAGQHFAFGYADQPPLIPWLAAALNSAFPGDPLPLRLPSAIASAASILLIALIARDLGGRRTAQVLSAGAYAVSSWLLWSGQWMTTYAIDPVWWLLVSWLVVRWVRDGAAGQRNDRSLLFAGITTAVALQTKYLIPVLWVGIAVGVLLSGPRSLFKRPLLWVGALIAIAATVPSLYWQATHGWPFIAFGETVSQETSRKAFAFGPLSCAGLIGAALLLYGLWRLFRSVELRPFRFLGWAALVVFAILLMTDARPYYPVGIYGVLCAVGAVEFERRKRVRWWPWLAWPAYILSAFMALWIMFASAVGVGIMCGKQTVQPLADAFHRELSPTEQAHTVVVTDLYFEAAIIEHYRAELRLPSVYSQHRGYWYFGKPPEDNRTVLYVSTPPGIHSLDKYFGKKKFLFKEENVSVYELSARKQSWQAIWPRIRSNATMF